MRPQVASCRQRRLGSLDSALTAQQHIQVPEEDLLAEVGNPQPRCLQAADGVQAKMHRTAVSNEG